MIRTEKRLRLCKVLLVLNLAFIWGNSMLPGEVSAAFSDWVKDLLASLLGGGMQSGGGRGLLRKLAHFTEFAALGMCLTWLYAMLQKHRGWALVWGAMAACVDETIQVFVPDRGPGLKDVGIDVLGVCTGMMLLSVGYHLRRKYKKHNIQEETT